MLDLSKFINFQTGQAIPQGANTLGAPSNSFNPSTADPSQFRNKYPQYFNPNGTFREGPYGYQPTTSFNPSTADYSNPDTIRQFFASKGVTPNSTSPDYWAKAWNEWGSKDPAYYQKFLNNAEELTGGSRQTAMNMWGFDPAQQQPQGNGFSFNLGGLIGSLLGGGNNYQMMNQGAMPYNPHPTHQRSMSNYFQNQPNQSDGTAIGTNPSGMTQPIAQPRQVRFNSPTQTSMNNPVGAPSFYQQPSRAGYQMQGRFY